MIRQTIARATATAALFLVGACSSNSHIEGGALGAGIDLTVPAATGYATSTIGFSGTMRLEGDRPFGVSTYGLGTDWRFRYAPAFAP